MGVVTRRGSRGPPWCVMCKVKEKIAESELCGACLAAEENIKSSAQDKTIYIQLEAINTSTSSSGVVPLWYAIEEKKQSPETLMKIENKWNLKGYMDMGENWSIKRLPLSKVLPEGYTEDEEIIRETAVSFGSRIYLFGGVRFPPTDYFPRHLVSEVVSFDVHDCKWYPAPCMTYANGLPCVVDPGDGERLLLFDDKGLRTFTPSCDNTGGSWEIGDVPQPHDEKFTLAFKNYGWSLFCVYEEDGRKKLLLYCIDRYLLVKYDLQSKSQEQVVKDFGRWHGGGLVLFNHYLFCFGVPGDFASRKPCSLYAFNLENLKLHSEVRNLPKPKPTDDDDDEDEDDDDVFPSRDEFYFHQYVCLLKINDSNDKLALVWNSTRCCGDVALLRVLKFTIAKSETGRLFEARILSNANCFVDGCYPISCLAMPGNDGEEGRFVCQQGQRMKKRKRT